MSINTNFKYREEQKIEYRAGKSYTKLYKDYYTKLIIQNYTRLYKIHTFLFVIIVSDLIPLLALSFNF